MASKNPHGNSYRLTFPNIVAPVEARLGVSYDVAKKDSNFYECKVVNNRKTDFGHLLFNVVLKYTDRGGYPEGLTDDDYDKVKDIGETLLEKDWIGSYVIQVANRAEIWGCKDELTNTAPHLCYDWDKLTSPESYAAFPEASRQVPKGRKKKRSIQSVTKADDDSSDDGSDDDDDCKQSSDKKTVKPKTTRKKSKTTPASDPTAAAPDPKEEDDEEEDDDSSGDPIDPNQYPEEFSWEALKKDLDANSDEVRSALHMMLRGKIMGRALIYAKHLGYDTKAVIDKSHACIRDDFLSGKKDKEWYEFMKDPNYGIFNTTGDTPEGLVGKRNTFDWTWAQNLLGISDLHAVLCAMMKEDLHGKSRAQRLSHNTTRLRAALDQAYSTTMQPSTSTDDSDDPAAN